MNTTQKALLRLAEFACVAVFGAWVESFLPLRHRDPDLTFVVMTTFVGVFLVTYYVVRHETAHASQVKQLAEQIDRLVESRGYEADLVMEPYPSGRGQYYRDLTALLTQTKPGDEIRVITFQAHPEHECDPGDQTYTEAQTDYFKILLQKARDGVTYKRLVCFPNLKHGAPLPLELMRDHMRDHCLDLLGIPAGHSNVTVKKARAELMADILLINRAAAAVTLDSPTRENHIHTGGALIVHSPPNTRILQRLEEVWTRLFNASDAMTTDELARHTQDETSNRVTL